MGYQDNFLRELVVDNFAGGECCGMEAQDRGGGERA